MAQWTILHVKNNTAPKLQFTRQQLHHTHYNQRSRSDLVTWLVLRVDRCYNLTVVVESRKLIMKLQTFSLAK